MNEEFFNLEDLKLEAATIDQIHGKLSEEEIKEDLDNKETIEVPDANKQEPENKEDNKDDKKTEDKVIDKAPSSKTEDSSTFSVFAKSLKEEGVISLDDEEVDKVNSYADLKNLIVKQIENSKFDNLSESQKRYLDAVEAGIPQAEFEKIEKQLNQLESIDDEVLEANQQARFDLIAFDYIEKGIPKEKAVELANRSIKLGTDLEDAKEALESLIKVKSEEYKNTLIKNKDNNKVSLEKLKETIDSKEVILKDVKLTPKFKTDLYNLLSNKVDADEAGQPLNELNKWRMDNKLEAEILLGALYLQTNKFQNLGKILDTAKSKSAIELEKKLKQNDASEMQNTVSFGQNKYEINI